MNKIIENEENNSLTSYKISPGNFYEAPENKQCLFSWETSNSENPNENNKRVKRTRNRPSKAERFSEEREKLIKELERMIGLTEEVRGVLLYDLKRNEELKEYLKNKIPDIRKLYKCGTWNYFVKQHTKEGEEPSEIGLLKSIFKSEKYKLKPSRLVAERGGEKKQYSAILFYKVYDLAEKIKI
jgi:hypothetical protein